MTRTVEFFLVGRVKSIIKKIAAFGSVYSEPSIQSGQQPPTPGAISVVFASKLRT
jgi:hypothetical protein